MDREPPRLRLAAALLAAVALAAPAWAADAGPDGGKDKGPPDQGGYGLFNPAPDDRLRDLCTDRPTKSTNACTVDPGRLQVESDLVSGSFQRRDGVTTDTWLYTNPTVKLGLADRLDAELNIAPVEEVRTRDHTGGPSSDLTGVGDLFLKLKYALLGNGGSDVAVALEPYLKAPTARRGIGNGAVEGGVLVPVSLNLPAKFTLNLDPELDVLQDQSGDGRHVQMIQLLQLGRPLGGGFTGAAEIWTQSDFDPSGTTVQASFDLGLSWSPKSRPDIQLDGGVNLGLNRATPGAQVYAGVSKRF